MSAEQALALGDSALIEGRWRDARVAFESALRESGAAHALAGLADACFFLGETRSCIDYQERAYAAFRRAGELSSAIDSALWLFHVQSSLGNRPAAGGWLARAESLIETERDQGHLAWLDYSRAVFTTDSVRAQELIERALTVARASGDIDLELCALAELGVVLTKIGDVEAGFGRLDEAMAAALAGDRESIYTVVATSCSMLTACDLVGDLDRVSQWAQAADAFTSQFGCPYLYAECRLLHGRVLVVTGHWQEAEDELAKAVAATAQVFRGMHNRTIASLADLRLRQGRLDEASELIAGLDAPIEVSLVAAALALGRGEPHSAVALVDRWFHARSGELVPPLHAGDAGISIAAVFAHSLLVQAHLAADDIDAADQAADGLDRLARASSAPFAAAMATVSRGRVAAARGDAEASIRSFENAVGALGGIGLPLEAARAHLELARVLFAEQRQLAVAEARTALTAFDRLGASADADVAAALLREWGEPGRAVPHTPDLLTRREQEVVALLAGGLSNHEIARRLYISPKTVAHHVSSALTKLGVRNRAEAAAYAVRTDLAGSAHLSR
ncbi:response regulator transcription factor [Diaminobutyricimonas sp. TR449]|uniref:helix-turn-helix transcriptional regulator n=1 Tax=Diaminobutyricimonas sp. TR449 TaxID=2708076 RepID=UPI002443E8EC|nr:response regulator transcription factor [Diaminobutyricimonas sp. TR449]